MEKRKYLTSSLIQQTLREHYPDHKMDIYDIYSYFSESHSLRDVHISVPPKSLGSFTDSEFEAWLLDVPFVIINPATFSRHKNTIEEPTLFGTNHSSNIYICRYINYYQDIVHCHSYFEMYYVFHGHCSLFFEEKRVDLSDGDFLIIAPGTPHFTVSDAENFILSMSVRQSDFESIFRLELAKDNLLALFFNNILFRKSSQGYLLFHTGDDETLKYAMKNMAMESMIRDQYNFLLANSWLEILLSNLVRTYYLNAELEMNPPIYGNRFSHILQYIQQNYQTVTLDILSRQFNYSKPYLCAMFKDNTGKTFSQVVNLQRIHAATILLDEGQYSIENIASHVGYASADHFSRTFKKIQGVAPTAYKAQHR